MTTCPACGHEWRLTRPGLTAAEVRVLSYLRTCIKNGNMGPSLREIGAATGMTAPNVHRIAGQLERKGWVMRESYRARSLRPIGD